MHVSWHVSVRFLKEWNLCVLRIFSFILDDTKLFLELIGPVFTPISSICAPFPLPYRHLMQSLKNFCHSDEYNMSL